MELKYDPRETINSLQNKLVEVMEERNYAEFARDRLKEEVNELQESLRNSKELWLKNEIKVGFLQKELREAHRDLEVAELRLKVMQLEESNARLREHNEEV